MGQLMLKRADVFLTRGPGFVSRMIRFVTRTIGESRTQVNHVGIVVEDGLLREVAIVEALSKVRRRGLWEAYGPPRKDWVAVYRPINLTEAEVTIVVTEAEMHWKKGHTYGYVKAVCHFLDWLLLGAYVFRRLARSKRYPICSWLVADAFKEAGKYFGVPPGAASPDDIWDFIQSNPDVYEVVYPLAPLREEG
ncbi:hypothetical protein K8S17_01635 [bacterium]|nr:hypothetical protein [bacterium]